MHIMSLNWRSVAWWTTVGLVLLGIVVAIVGDHSKRPALLEIGVVCTLTCVFALPIVFFVTKQPVLLLGILPSAAMWSVTGVAKAFTVSQVDYVKGGFVLVMTWMIPLVVWGLLTWGLFHLARRWKKRLVRGPLTELTALLFLMSPWILAAFVLPEQIDTANDTVTIVASIAIGLMWGKVVSEPFAKLVQAIRGP